MLRIKCVIAVSLWIAGLPAAYCAEMVLAPELNRSLQQVETAYGIRLHYAEGPATKPVGLVYGLAGNNDNPGLEKAIRVFLQEVSLYPKNFFRYADCQDIYFVHKLFYKEKPADGLFSSGVNYIFYDYSRGRDNTPKIRHNIHHELYHLLGSKHPFWKEHGPAWEALNHADFSYNRELDPRKRNPINFYAPPEPGFITDYAMTSAEEDRAEVFACLMIPEQRKLMEQWAEKDGILAKKLELMRKFLREAY